MVVDPSDIGLKRLVGKTCYEAFFSQPEIQEHFTAVLTRKEARRFLVRFESRLYQAALSPTPTGLQGIAMLAIDETSINKILVQSNLEKALANNELALFTQPVVHLESGTVVGYEGLVRWVTEDGIIMPDVFLPLANGLMESICLRVAELGTALLKSWESIPEKKDKFLSLNIAPKSITQEFTEKFNAICDRSGISRHLLHLEITEEQAFEINIAGFMGQQKRREHRLKLDDYGKGDSSDHRMLSLPFDDVKFDKMFLRQVFDDSDRINHAMAAALLSKFDLCRRFYLTIIMEGIESEAQRQWLIANKIQYGQGYLLGRPERPQ